MQLLTDHPAGRRKESKQPWRKDHKNAQAENASSALPPVSYADSIKRTLSCSTSSACQFAAKSTAKGSEDAIVHKKDNDDTTSRLCNAPSGAPTCTTENRSIMNTTTPPSDERMLPDPEPAPTVVHQKPPNVYENPLASSPEDLKSIYVEFRYSLGLLPGSGGSKSGDGLSLTSRLRRPIVK